MIGESTYKKVKDKFICRALDLLVVKGITEPVRVYELIATVNDTLPDEKKKFLEISNDGLGLYRSMEWD